MKNQGPIRLDARAAKAAVEDVDARTVNTVLQRLRQLLEGDVARTTAAQERVEQKIDAMHAQQAAWQRWLLVITAMIMILIGAMALANTLYTRRHTTKVVGEEVNGMAKMLDQAYGKQTRALNAKQEAQRSLLSQVKQTLGELTHTVIDYGDRLERVERRLGIRTNTSALDPVGHLDTVANSPRCHRAETSRGRNTQGWWQLTCTEDDGHKVNLLCRTKILGAFSGCYTP